MIRIFLFSAFGGVFIFAIVVGADFLKGTTQQAELAAVFTNDSNVVEIDLVSQNTPNQDTQIIGHDESSPSQDLSNPVPTVSVEHSISNESNPSIPALNTSNITSPIQDAVPVVIAVPPIVEDLEVGGSSASGNLNSALEKELSNEALLTTLIGSQALVISSGRVGNGSIRVHGDRLRDALDAQDIALLVIPDRFSLLTKKTSQPLFSRNDFSLFVAERVLQDISIDSVLYVNGELTVRYKAPGRLFGFVPVTYNLTVTASFRENFLKDVSLRFPWYSFFLAKGVSEKGLEARVREAVALNLEGLGEGQYDVAVQAFVGVSDVLRRQLGDT